MLIKTKRLSRSDFAAVLTAGTRVYTPHTTIVTAPHQRGACAVVVSKKVANTAVARNRARRRTYAALRALRHLWEHKKAVVFLKPGAADCAQTTLQRELETALARR